MWRKTRRREQNRCATHRLWFRTVKSGRHEASTAGVGKLRGRLCPTGSLPLGAHQRGTPGFTGAISTILGKREHPIVKNPLVLPRV